MLLYTIYLREERMGDALFALRHHFGTNLYSAEFFSEGIVGRARKASGYSTAEGKIALTKRSLDAKLPMVLMMLDWLRVELWVKSSWDTATGRDAKMAYRGRPGLRGTC